MEGRQLRTHDTIQRSLSCNYDNCGVCARCRKRNLTLQVLCMADREHAKSFDNYCLDICISPSLWTWVTSLTPGPASAGCALGFYFCLIFVDAWQVLAPHLYPLSLRGSDPIKDLVEASEEKRTACAFEQVPAMNWMRPYLDPASASDSATLLKFDLL